MENEKLFDLMEKMYGEMKNGFNNVDKKLNSMEERLSRVEKTVLNIEHSHDKKLQALFDGYKQHSDQLDRIEKQVSKQEEFILKRVK